MRFSTLASAAALVASASATENYLGFNSGATLADRSAKFEADFLAEFKTAQGLAGAPGKFNAVRLYTNIQAYSQQDPIQAFSAAVKTQTRILLGIWTSGTDDISKELNALNTAVKQLGKPFTDLVIGISIGSEDLYRDSATGRQNKAGVGNGPQQIAKFIGDYKKSVANTALSSVPIGHVDTWDAWVNGTNKQVLEAVDWVGVDEYPFYESGKGNSIKNAGTLFDQAYDTTINVAGGKPVWVTETGWPYMGPNWDQAVPSVANAQKYWQEVGCRRLFNKAPTFWYNLRDSNPDNEVKFGISPTLSTTTPFDLSCPDHFDTPTHTGSRAATASHSSSSSQSSDSADDSSSDESSADGSSPSHTTLTRAQATGTATSSGSGHASGTSGVVATGTVTNGASAFGFSGAAYAVVALAAGYVALL